MRPRPRIAVLSTILLFLAGCAGVQFVPPYNQNITDGLNVYHVDMLDFVSTMNTRRSPLSGTYKSKPIGEFYSSRAAALDNLVVQAEAADPNGNCASSRFASLALGPLTSGVEELSAELDGALGGTGGLPDDSDLTTGGCTVIALKALAANHRSVEKLHRLEGKLVSPASDIVRDLISDGVRIALTAEVAKL